MSTVSVVTLARGRPGHLRNVLIGLERQTQPPAEFIVAVMQDAPYDLPETSFPVRQILVPGAELPLATARNRGVAAASGETIVFLDVDCIPSPDLVADYARGLSELDGLLMGEVLHLPEHATSGDWTCEGFNGIAEKHSDRRGPPKTGIEICTDYRCFWSLSFAMRRATFLAIGGFDERYRGYGGEDTDFGKILDRRGIPIAWIKGALSYHHITGTTCRRSIISTAWSAMRNCSRPSGAIARWATGSTPSRSWASSTIRRIGRSASYDGRMPTTSP